MDLWWNPRSNFLRNSWTKCLGEFSKEFLRALLDEFIRKLLKNSWRNPCRNFCQICDFFVKYLNKSQMELVESFEEF